MLPSNELRAFQVVQWDRIHLPVQEMQEAQVWPLGWEDALEQEMATCSSILTWKMSWAEESDGLQPTDCKELEVTEHTCMPVN